MIMSWLMRLTAWPPRAILRALCGCSQQRFRGEHQLPTQTMCMPSGSVLAVGFAFSLWSGRIECKRGLSGQKDLFVHGMMIFRASYCVRAPLGSCVPSLGQSYCRARQGRSREACAPYASSAAVFTTCCFAGEEVKENNSSLVNSFSGAVCKNLLPKLSFQKRRLTFQITLHEHAAEDQ